MSLVVVLRAALALAVSIALSGCYTSETAVLTADDTSPLPGVSE